MKLRITRRDAHLILRALAGREKAHREVASAAGSESAKKEADKCRRLFGWVESEISNDA